MDILTYDILLERLKEYNSKVEENYGNVIVPYPTSGETTYPYTVFSEIRNVANRQYNTIYDKVSSIGYRVDIYAKTKGKINKQTIARNIMKYINYFLTYNIGFLQVSYNAYELVNDGSTFNIILTYSANLHENRRKII